MRTFRNFTQLFVLAIVFLLPACGNPRGWPQRHPVRATVLFEGKPPVGATVILRPAAEEARTVSPQGKVAADGSVVFTTYESGDGAAAGDYVLTAFWFKGDGPPNLLPERYRDPETSKIPVHIEPGPNDLGQVKLAR
jgi:hypothetical protein